MPEWTQFREAVAAGLPNAELLTTLRTLGAWLDLGSAPALNALDEKIGNSDPQMLYRCLVILNLTIQREAGIPAGTESGPALQLLFSEVRLGTASENRKQVAARLSVLWELGGVLLQKFPSLNQPPTAADLARLKLQQEATSIFHRMNAVANQLAPGTVSETSLTTIEGVVRDAKALAAGAVPDNTALSYVFSMTGSAERTLAGCYAILGRNQDALKAFAAAAEDFNKAGEPESAEDCGSRARDLQQHLSGSLDAAAEQPLAALSATVSVTAAAASGQPADSWWERVKSLMQLCSIAGTAADTFEALQNADAAAKTLVASGYRDPGDCGAEAAMDSWIRTACADLKGTALLRRVSQVSTFYDGILGARFAVLVRREPAKADFLQALQTELQKLSAQMREAADSAVAAAGHEFERYFPPAPAPPGEAEVKAPPSPDFEAAMDRMRAVDAAIIRIQQTCNQRADAGQSMDNLLDEIGKLEAESDTLNSPLYEAKTRLQRAYILLKLGRGADLGPVAREARRRLLAGRTPSLSSFALSHERYYYLDSLNKEAMGCVMTGDFEGSLGICEDTVRDFETQRYRVNSEYRQSALLSWVSDFYTWAAFSAFKLKRWDNMLDVIDLIKARSAIRSRLIPDAPLKLNSDLQQEFEELNASLEHDPGNESFKVRRRQLWDLLSIVRAPDGWSAEIPALSVTAIQAALEEDEALIGYFWLAETVILTIAVDKERFQAERIVLKPDELGRLNEFVEFVSELKSSNRRMDKWVSDLGAILLPDFLREFIKTKKRIVFSPHHSLHLFPFHAASWNADGFVGTEFAVRYVPNFISVVMPWAQRTTGRVLAIGIRDFADKNVQPLDNVEDDAVAIAEFYRARGSAVETALGTDATRERIEALCKEGILQQFRCVHLGTHGLSVFETPDQPLESRLLVQNGALDAMDIANLGLNAELVVMSACHSGQRAIRLRDLGDIPGDDIFGLQAALFRSGVRSILGTLWLVETKSASPVTRAFHRHYAEGKPPEVALQLSVKEYLAAAPALSGGVYYWAPYFISSIGSMGSARTGDKNRWQN